MKTLNQQLLDHAYWIRINQKGESKAHLRLQNAEKVVRLWLTQKLDLIALGEFDGYSLSDFVNELIKETQT